ncbi:lysophospholipase L1-like esterase [Georgenia soli]|uniref:Lysophospholipase L1-like esterase n=1 Tax=Georgenia soli TaxID=638953 RepID=A0A2A9ERX2_9MICO|nr:lysophospholipase L1-like esterase [Georgenia soli]
MAGREVETVRIPTVALALSVAVLLGGCGGQPAPAASTAAPPNPDATRLAVVGDSITEADSPDFDGGELGAESWVRHAVGEDLLLVGGWARWGATTSQMAAAVEPVDADVLVILAGTNDVGSGATHESTLSNLRRIAGTVGAPEVVISAVPPIDAAPELATDLNAALENLARQEGWRWVDAPAGLRDGEQFAEGMASDGLHPTREGARVLGEAIRETVLAAAAPTPAAGGRSGTAGG